MIKSTKHFQLEIGLCLTYASLNLAVNFCLLIGIKTPNGLYFLPWMSWTLLCITLSVTFAPVMIYVGAHILVLEEENKKEVDSTRFITYGALLLFKAGNDQPRVTLS